MDLTGPQLASPAALAFRLATPADTAAIARLVNSAYRGEASRAGWTTEADLLGGQRTDAEAVAALIAPPDSLMLLAFMDESLVACAHLERDAEAVWLGMFAVQPLLQNRGIGRQFLDTAENFARTHWHAERMRMSVISLRETLIAYYARRGYRLTGSFKPFPRSTRFGIPQVDGLRLSVLEKRLEQNALGGNGREHESVD